MNQELAITLALVGTILSALLVVGCIYLTGNIREIGSLLDKSLRSFGEADGERYRSEFATLLWQEKRVMLEKELSAYKQAHEKVSKELIELTERFNGLEKAYHEARTELSASGILLRKADLEEGKKRKRKAL